MDLSSLVEEMGAMDDLTRRLAPSTRPTLQRPPFSMGPAAKAKVVEEPPFPRRAVATPKPAAGEKKKLIKHATHGAAPVELMTQFLVLVSTGKMREALDVGQQILVFEPDNPLIKMYHEAMTEYLARGIVEDEGDEQDDQDSSDGEGDEQAGEGKDGDEDDEEEEEEEDSDKEEEKGEEGEDEEEEEKEEEEEAKAPSSERKEARK